MSDHRTWVEKPSNDPQTTAQLAALVAIRDMSGETVLGMRVAAYRQPVTKPDDVDQQQWDRLCPLGAGHRFATHWSTLHGDNIERMFTEQQVRDLLASLAKESTHE